MMNAVPQAMRFLMAIVDRGATQDVVSVLKDERLLMNCMMLAEGTAGTDLMALLGLDSREKTFVGCVVPKDGSRELTSRISDRLRLRRRGVGIAFSMALTGINSAAMRASISGAKAGETGGDVMDTEDIDRYSLITATVNEGHVEDVMQAARAAGARGGTVLRARRVMTEASEDERVIAGAADKDIVMIVAPRDIKNDIMVSISETCGVNSKAQGMLLSFAIEDVIGIGETK